MPDAAAAVGGKTEPGAADHQCPKADAVHILMLNHEYPPLGGGAGRVAAEVATELVAIGHGVTVVTTRCGAQPSHEIVGGIDTHRVYSKRRSLLENDLPFTMPSYLLLGAAKAHQLAGRISFDVIHAFFTIPGGLVGSWLSRRTGLPLVVSLHGADVPHHGSSGFSSVIRSASPLITRIWQHADRVTSVSEGLLATARKTAPLPHCRVVPNGIDLDLFRPPQTRQDNDVVRLISVARLVECKGLQYLLESLRQLRTAGEVFRLNVYGDGDYRRPLIALAEQLGLSDWVHFRGNIPHEQLPRLYGQSDIFVLPSLAESFGQVFVEAMACGLPVVGTNVGGIPEAVGRDQAPWLAKPGDVVGLSDKLGEMLRSPDLRERLGQTNARLARDQFGWPGIVSQYADLYRLAVANRGGPPEGQ